MKKNSTITGILCGLAAMLATVVFYLLAFDNIFTIPMRWLSMTGLLIVEVIGTVKALATKRNILGVAQLTIAVIHLVATLAISIVFVNLFPLLIKEYILVSILMMIIVTVADVLLLHFNGKFHIATEKYATSASVIEMCESMVRQLWIENKETAYASQLEAIVEMLTYTNRAMTSANDTELLSKIEELDTLITGNETDNLNAALQQIQNILKMRKASAKKTGKF